MCKMRVVVRREMLGAREQAWLVWTGKDITEYTGNQIKSLIKSGQKVCGLTVDGSNELVLDKEGFFTTNIMEHRYCGNYTPMIENEIMANLFYIVIGSHEENKVVYYDCISTKFEQAKFTEADVKAYIRLGIIPSGAKLDGDKIVVAPLDFEKATVAKPEKKKAEGEGKKDKEDA